jgi:hypothetical protein
MKNIHVIPTDKPSRFWMTKLGNLTRCHDIKPIKEALGNNVNISITNDEEIKKGDYFYSLFQGEERILKYNKFVIPFPKDKKIILTDNQDLIQNGVQAIPDEFLEWFVKNPSCEMVKIDSYKTIFHSWIYKIIIPKEDFDFDELHYKETFESRQYYIPKEEPKQLFTDYPITELGDEEFKESPIRECELLSYDDNKYCYVKVEGIEKEIKRCYIYPQKGRCGDVDCVSIDEIKELLKEEPKQETLEEATERVLANNIDGLKDALQDDDLFFFYKGVIQCYGEAMAKYQSERMYSEEEVINAFNEGQALNVRGKLIQGKEWFEQNKKK